MGEAPATEGAASGVAVRCIDVQKVFGSGSATVRALRGIDLEIGFGQFVVILGPSGSGKTTLLNLLGGIETATAGRIEVAGQDITGLREPHSTRYRRDQVGFVFQFFNLVPTLTARENVQLIAELAGTEAAARTEDVLKHVDLADHMDRFPGQLSGGEQQRVAIARAMVKEPPLLLCDEPTGSLDLQTGRQVLEMLRALAREGHHTVVLVTHNSAIAAMADRVLRMSSGRIVADQQVQRPIEARDLQW